MSEISRKKGLSLFGWLRQDPTFTEWDLLKDCPNRGFLAEMRSDDRYLVLKYPSWFTKIIGKIKHSKQKAAVANNRTLAKSLLQMGASDSLFSVLTSEQDKTVLMQQVMAGSLSFPSYVRALSTIWNDDAMKNRFLRLMTIKLSTAKKFNLNTNCDSSSLLLRDELERLIKEGSLSKNPADLIDPVVKSLTLAMEMNRPTRKL